MTDDDATPGAPVPVSLASLERLAAWAPRLAAMDSAGEWRGGEADADGVIQVPWFERSDEVDAFTREMAAADFVRPVDWMAWRGTPRAQALFADPGAVADATPAELVYLLTSIVRGERFGDGEIEAAFDRGLLLAIAQRGAALVR